MTLDEAKIEYAKWLYLPNPNILDLLFGVVVVNNLDINGVNLHLVGASGSGKTELLDSLEGYSRVYELGKPTTHTFVSGFGGEKKGGKVSLILELKEMGKRILTIKEFSQILTLPEEAKGQILSDIREIADGKLYRKLGNGVRIRWRGRIGFITGVTEAIDKAYSVTQELGERFLYWRMDTDLEEQPMKAIENIHKQTEKKEALSNAAGEFLDQFDNTELRKVPVPNNIIKKIHALARFVSGVRTPISKDRFSHHLNYLPSLEVATRLIQQLYNLAVGIALVRGKPAVDEDIYRQIICRVARDTIHSIRKNIMESMWLNRVHSYGWIPQNKLCNLCKRIYRPTLIAYLGDLIALGVLEYEEGERQMRYRITSEWVNLIKDSEIYDSIIKPEFNSSGEGE